jgi:hypothetical protein
MYDDRHLEKLHAYIVKKENRLIAAQKAEDTDKLFNLIWSVHIKDLILSNVSAEK